MLKRIIESGMYLSIGVLIAKLLSVSYTLVLARILGPEEMGAFTLSLLLVSWFSIVALLSVQTVSTQLISEYVAKKIDISKPITASLFLGTTAAVLATIVHFFIAGFVATTFYNDTGLTKYIQFASLIIFGTVIFHTALGIERGMKKFVSYATIESSKQAIMLGIGLFFLLALGWRIMGAIAAAIIAPGIIAIVVYVRYRKYFNKDFWPEAKRIFKLGLGITLMSAFITVFTSIDKFILGVISTKEIVGLYVPAITIVTFLGLFLPGSMKNAVFPYVVESYTKGEYKEARHYMEKVLLYYNMLVGIAIIPAMFFRREGIALAFGSDYLAAVEPLAIMLFGAFYFSMFIIMQSFVLGTNKIKEGIYATALSVGIATVTNFILISNFGLNGAAYALVINTLILATSYSYIVKKAIGLRLRKLIFSLVILNGILLLSYFLSSYENLFVRIGLSLIVIGIYLGLLFLFKFIGKGEINFVLAKVEDVKAKLFKPKTPR